VADNAETDDPGEGMAMIAILGQVKYLTDSAKMAGREAKLDGDEAQRYVDRILSRVRDEMHAEAYTFTSALRLAVGANYASEARRRRRRNDESDDESSEESDESDSSSSSDSAPPAKKRAKKAKAGKKAKKAKKASGSSKKEKAKGGGKSEKGGKKVCHAWARPRGHVTRRTVAGRPPASPDRWPRAAGAAEGATAEPAAPPPNAATAAKHRT